MAVASRKEFIACVTKSTVIPDDQLKPWLASAEDTDPMKLASKMVRDKLLTPWQAKFLISGRSRLRVGNYILQTRTSSDELGDKFEAFHASLNRKVVIQFFPSAIAKDEELLEKLLKKLRQITELDHPNLVHVYDVDQEGERYFLITEFVEGQFLKDVPREDLDDSQIAVIVQDIAAGLTHAHQTKIIHGNVTNENIILTPDGQAKLEGFPASTLLSEINHDPNAPPKVLSEATDFKRLAVIGVSLLKEIPQTARSDQFNTIADLFRQLGMTQTPGPKVEQLNEWVDRNVEKVSTPLDDDSEETDFDPLAVVTPGELGSFPTNSPVRSKQSSPTSPDAEVKKPRSKNIVAKLWRQQRGAFYAFATAILLTLGCIIGMLIYAFSPSDENIARQTPSPLAINDASQTDATASGDSSAGDDNILDPEATKKRLAEFYAEQQRKKAAENKATEDKPDKDEAPEKTAKTKRPSPPKDQPKEAEPVTLTDDTDVADSDTEDAEPVIPEYEQNPEDKAMAEIDTSADPETSAEMASVESSTEPSEENTAEPEPEAKEKEKSKREPKPVEIGNPFKEMIANVDLPESTNTEDFQMTDLVIEENHLLGLDLISGPQISRGKFELILNRSDDDNQLWDLAIQAKRSDPVNVAQFQKTPTEMTFRWLPAAAENEDANYLRNCKLKLTTPNNTGYLGLRKPVTISGLIFAEDAASVKTEVEAQWLPNPDALQIELKPFSTGDRADEVNFNPREITKRNPGQVFFRSKDDEKLFSVIVTADFRKNIRLNAQMTLNLPNSKPKALRTKADLDNFFSVVELEKTKANQFNQQAQMTKTRPTGMNKEEFNRIKDEANTKAEQMNDAFTLAAGAVETSKRLADVEIPVTIFFEMDGNPVVIAETPSK